MRHRDESTIRCGLITAVTLALLSGAGTTNASPAAIRASRIPASLAVRGVPFIANAGQIDERVAFYAPGSAGMTFVTRKGQLVYSLQGRPAQSSGGRAALGANQGWTLSETLVAGRALPIAGRVSETKMSFFHGRDAAQWRSGVATYAALSLGEVWPHIEVSLRTVDEGIEKVFTLNDGANVDHIRVRVDGAQAIEVTGTGELVLHTGIGDARLSAPNAYQDRGGTRQSIPVRYVVHGRTYGFDLGPYDQGFPVVIDPVLQATYLGGSSNDVLFGMAIDPGSGDVIVVGSSVSQDFPTTVGALRPTGGGPKSDAFVARLSADLKTLRRATYLGGSNNEGATSVVVDGSGDVIVAGDTVSDDFPGTAGGADTSIVGVETFVSRLSGDLSTLDQSTYFGGSADDQSIGLARQPVSGDLILLLNTLSRDLPGGPLTDPTPLPGTFPAITRLSPDLHIIRKSAFIFGQPGLPATALAIDPGTDDIVVGGDPYTARLRGDLSALQNVIQYGGSAPVEVDTVAVDPASGDVIFAGNASFVDDLRGTAGGAQPAKGGFFADGFVVRYSGDLTTRRQATYLGGMGGESVDRVAIDPASGDVFAVGQTSSADFPGVTGGAMDTIADSGAPLFITRFNGALTSIRQSTFLGGGSPELASALVVDSATGDVLVSGSTSSTDFPWTSGGFQEFHAGGLNDGFVARLTGDLLAGPPMPTRRPSPTGTRTFTRTPRKTATPTATRTGGALPSATATPTPTTNVATPTPTAISARLGTGLSASDTAIPVDDVSQFPNAGVVRIDDELIGYTGKTTQSASVGSTAAVAPQPGQLLDAQRGLMGTTASAHSAGAPVILFASTAPCVGDCDGSGQVGVDELVKGVNIALGNATPDACLSLDSDHSGVVTVDELVKAVNNALGGCS